MSTWSLRPEPDIHRLVVVNLKSLRLAADARVLLVGLGTRDKADYASLLASTAAGFLSQVTLPV